MPIVRRIGAWFGGGIGVLFVTMALLCIPDWGFLNSEITHYHVYCSIEARDSEGGCPQVEVVFPRTIYTVDVDKQEVFGRLEKGCSSENVEFVGIAA